MVWRQSIARLGVLYARAYRFSGDYEFDPPWEPVMEALTQHPDALPDDRPPSGVLVHCVAAQSRTLTVAIAYAMHRGIEREAAYRCICAALPAATPNTAFRAALKRLEYEATVAA